MMRWRTTPVDSPAEEETPKATSSSLDEDEPDSTSQDPVNTAKAAGADIFITGDIKYHDFFEHHGQMTIVDAGHYETEQFTKASE